MRGDPPRLPARPAAAASTSSASSADEVRPLPGDPSARRRDEASGRRQASASRLMGAVTRHLLDEAEEERVTGESSRDVGSGAAPTASTAGSESTGKSAAKAGARAASGGGKSKASPRGMPGPVTRRGASSAHRAAPPEDDVWAQGVDAADGAGRIVGPESRIQPRRSAARVDGVRPEATERVGRSPRMRIASWGAVLAAIAALVVMIAAGWLDVGPQPSSGDAGGENHRQQGEAR